MIIRHAIMLLCISFYITNSKLIEVEFDEGKDLIIKDGKIYLPLKDQSPELVEVRTNLIRILNYEDPNSPENLDNPCPSHEETLEGASYWFCLLFILCKFIKI
jgi:hypothetical protein